MQVPGLNTLRGRAPTEHVCFSWGHTQDFHSAVTLRSALPKEDTVHSHSCQKPRFFNAINKTLHKKCYGIQFWWVEINEDSIRFFFTLSPGQRFSSLTAQTRELHAVRFRSPYQEQSPQSQKYLGAMERNTHHVEIGKGTHCCPIDRARFYSFDPHVVSQQHTEYGDTWVERHGKVKASLHLP